MDDANTEGVLATALNDGASREDAVRAAAALPTLAPVAEVTRAGLAERFDKEDDD